MFSINVDDTIFFQIGKILSYPGHVSLNTFFRSLLEENSATVDPRLL